VARGTLNRPRLAVLVTPFAVHVQGVAPLGVAIRAVAILTATRLGIILFFVMAIITRKPVPFVSRVCLVVKQDASCGRLKHNSNRFFRRLGGESRIADNTDNEQNSRKGKCQRLSIL
jgi:hypothetical protein